MGPSVSGSPASRLVEVVASVPLEGRLAGVPYRPYRPGAGGPASLPASLLQAASQLQKSTDRRDAEVMRGLAAFELLRNQPQAAVALLLDAVTWFPSDAMLWNDLSVAYIDKVRSERDNDLRFASRALDAALQAFELAPGRPEPQFNVGVCLRMLGLHAGAHDAWQRAAMLDQPGRWREEGQRRASTAHTGDPTGWQPESGHGNLRASASLIRAAARAPQPVREWVEQHALPDWGRAILRGDAKQANDLMGLTETVAAAIATRSGDRLLVDVAMEMARADPRTARNLACGFVAHAEGVEQYESALREDSFQSFRTAHRCFTAARSAFLVKTELQVSILRYQLRQVAAARQGLVDVVREAQRNSYPVLGGLAEWTLGLAYMQSGEIGSAVSAYRSAALAFERAGEGQNFAAANSAAADTLRRIGEHSQGWSFLDRALDRLSEVQSARRRYTILFNASLYAEDDGLARTSLWFQSAALDAARARGTANTIIEALARRARLYLDSGRRDEALRDLDQAEHLLPSVSSASARAYVTASLQRSRAHTLIDSDPRRSLALLEAARHFFARGETTDVATLFLEEGLAYRRLGQSDEAERRFLAGLDNVEGRSSLLSRADYRVAYLDEAWPLYEALIDSRVTDADEGAAAFDVAERARARSLTPNARVRLTTGFIEVQRVLAADVTVMSYVVLNDRLVIWVITRNARRLVERRVLRDVLVRQISAFSQAIEAGRPAAELKAAAVALFDLLIPAELVPSGSSGPLVLVPDGALNALPFAALVDRRTGQYLVESRSVLLASSVTEGLSAGPARTPESPRPLLLGGRTANPVAGLRALPQAASELLEIAAMYRSRTLLQDDQATLSNLARELPHHNVLHFAGHAVANDRFPWRSTLMLAGDRKGEDQGLSLERLMALDLSRLDLVVLSACRTAAGPVAHGEGVINLMRPFLAARVPAVVGSLWDVDDTATRALMTRFHSSLRKGAAPIDALRGAQLSLLADSDQALRHPRSWAAFLVTGRLPPRNTATGLASTLSGRDQHRGRTLRAR